MAARSGVTSKASEYEAVARVFVDAHKACRAGFQDWRRLGFRTPRERAAAVVFNHALDDIYYAVNAIRGEI